MEAAQPRNRPTGPTCTPVATTEATCSGGVDDDCDGYPDCLDTECDGQPCGDGLTCSGGACRAPCPPGVSCVPDLPAIQNVRVTTRGDTAIIDFEPVAGAGDYRIYPDPDPADWLIGADGEVGVRNGIYRCAGDRVFQAREADGANLYDCSITGCDNTRHDYVRTEAESILGYVYLTPGRRSRCPSTASPTRTAAAASATPTGSSRSTARPTAPST